MEVRAHLDPAVLEHSLLSGIAAASPRGEVSRVLVVVPTSRLAEHVQRRLAAERRAWLGVEVLHFRALCRRILEQAGAPSPRLLSPRLVEALLRSLLLRRDRGEWSRFLERRPRAARRLLASLRELREASIGPDEVERAGARRGGEWDLAEIYRDFTTALDRLAGRGWVDEAGLVGQALPHAAGLASSYRALYLHGAYELIGIHLDLIRELDRARAVTALLPMQPGAAVSRYADAFARRHLTEGGATLLEPERSGRQRQLAALYDEESRPEPAAPGTFFFQHAQGPAGEVRSAVREALAAVREGVPPNEIVIAARGLAPYAGALEETLEQEGLAWTTSLAMPLRRDPFVHDLLLLLRALERDFPRRATAELLRSPRILRHLLPGRRSTVHGERADRWSREAGIVGGLAEWTDDLTAWAAEPRLPRDPTDEEKDEATARARERAEGAREIGRALVALRDRVEPDRRRRWSGHARMLEGLIESVPASAATSSGAAIDAMRGLLDEMRALETVLDQTEGVSLGEMVDWLEDAADGAELAPWRRDSGGIRVLDAMQLRGLTARRLLLLGMNAGQFPHPARHDALLDDELRLRLRESTGRPLPVKSEGIREERLLLALLLGVASERVHVFWQRADEAGRARTPSLALREIARITRGEPDMPALIAEARHLPSHPGHWLEEMAARPGLLSPNDERLLTVLRSRKPSAALRRRFSEMAPGLEMLEATEEFAMVDPAWDGRIGPGLHRAESLSPTGLEQLGRCPLQYFYQRVLRLRELDEEASPFEIEKKEMGSRVHLVLEQLYGTLAQEGLFASARAEPLVRRARELLPPGWDRAMGGLGARMSRRAPVLWESLRGRWIDSLDAFVVEDLERIVARGWGRPALEQTVTEQIELERGARLRVTGRFDRVFETEGGKIVADYKTGDIRRQKPDDPTEMLKARALQVPLYWLVAGPGSAVELLGLGPHFDFSPEADLHERRKRFDGFDNDQQLAGFKETLQTLVALADQGSFPIHPNAHCSWCAYRLACRKEHPPTLEREASAQDSASYRLLARKNKSKLRTLAQVRGARS